MEQDHQAGLPSAADCLAGGGETGALMRSIDWARTPLGPVEVWPQSLRTAVGICLNSRFPIVLWWGPELVMLYNDAYRPILGATKHPQALGRRGSEVWPEIWHVIGPMLMGVMERGEATWSEDRLLMLDRNGYLEECYFTFSYSLIRDELGRVGGIFTTLTETTARVLSERRLRTLRALGEQTAQAQTAEESCACAARVFEGDSCDLPFALCYLLEASEKRARLAGAANLAAETPVAPAVVELGAGEVWPFSRVVASGGAEVVTGLEERFGRAGEWLPGTAGPRAPAQAVVLPLMAGQARPVGFLVAGLSPHLAFDDDYRAFLELVARQVATGVANARAYAEVRRAEATLLQAAQQLRLVTDSVPVFIIYCDTELRYRFVNSRYAELRGLQPEDLIGRRIPDVLGAEAFMSFAAYVERALAGEAVEFEVEIPYRDVGRRFVHCVCTPDCGPAGEVRGFVAVFDDVTEWRRAEGSLRESEERFRAMSDSAPVMIWVAGADKHRTFFNKPWLNFTGRTMGQELGSGWAEGVHPSDFERCLETYHSSFDARQPFKMEYRLRRADSEYCWVLDHGVPRFAPDGEFLGYIGSVIDITERKQAESANAYLAAIINSSSDAIVSKTLDGIITSWNQGAERIFGYSAAEIVGQSILRLIPEDRWAEEDNIFSRLRQGLCVEHFETKRRRKDGRLIDVSVTISPIRDARGAVIGASKVARDITERKRAEAAIRQNEERLRLAVDAAHLGTWDWDIEQDRSQWGGYHAQLFGVSEREWISSDEFISMVHPDDRELVTQATARAISGGEEYNVEFRIIRPDGAVRWMRDQGIVYRDEAGRARRMIGVVQDVTAHKRAEVERELRLAQERELRELAEAASRSKDEFLAIVSHELRSPLNAMLGWTRVLQSRLGDPDTLAHGLEVIERSARAQQQLIEDLLDTARIISGKLRLETGPVDLPLVINNALDVMRPAAEARGIEIRCHFAPHADLITGDAERLQQVVWNLLSNAIKFTPAGGRVEVRLERADPYAQITVTDTGEGIAPDFLPHVFDRFHQADSSSTRRHGGLGLGLALVRHLVELHGGTITAASEGKGKGAAFTVRLPLRAVRVRDAVEESSGVRSPRAGELMLAGLRVLVVDDDADARDIVKILLGQFGAEVAAAASAPEALELFCGGAAGPNFDVLVSDLSMPQTDGYALMRRVRELERERGWPRMPAVALTAFGRHEDYLQALASGFQTHLTKPVELGELAAVIAMLTGRAAGQGVSA